jgi:ferredoxin
MVKRLVVDAEKCILAGECVYNHPDYFGWNDDESAIVVLKTDVVTSDDERHADESISLCPGGAIAVVETAE